MIQYLDKKGRLLFVSKGIGYAFATFYRKGDKRGLHRVKSSALPLRTMRSEAEDDLRWYALEHDLVPVTISHNE